MASTGPAAPDATPEPSLQVYVRMYRALQPDAPDQGMLGDCFLLRLVQGARTSHILIDCGMLLGSANADARMRAIAADIVKTTGGTLDLLVVTHEHWDHISGFSQAADVFLATEGAETLRIANLWLAWTEKDGDPQVERLRTRFDKAGFALNALVARLDRQGVATEAPVVALKGFRGASSNGAKRLQGREIIARLKRKSRATPLFLEPGTVLSTPAADSAGPSLRAYVLGPPRDEKFLFKDRPSAGPAQETYLADLKLSDTLLRFAEGDAAGVDPDTPFAPQYRTLRAADVKAAAEAGEPLSGDAAWIAEHYYGVAPHSTGRSGAARAASLAAILDRRTIETDWLGAADPLAMKLDSDTNNTSLALAFDLPDGTSMVFAADAQVGNWLSWHEHSYRDENGRMHSAEQILNRTRFYKVGHHGSHNATLDAKGLAMMTRDDLVAAISTDEALGRRQGRGGWQMPNPRVKAALLARTKGRILRNDRHYGAEARAADPELRDVEPGFFDKLNEQELYLEFRVL